MTMAASSGRSPRTQGERACMPTAALAAPGMLIAESLGRTVRDAGLHVVGCYGNLDALLEKMRRCRPQVVIADAALRECPDGADTFLAQLRAAGPEAKLVVLAGEVDGPLARAVVAHGACAVI